MTLNEDTKRRILLLKQAIWYSILHPRPVVQSFVYDMSDSTNHIWGDEKQKPIKMQIPNIPPEAK